MKPSPYPFCVDCLHCKTAEELGEFYATYKLMDGPFCDYTINVVTGKPTPYPCQYVRTSQHVCGLEGRLFEPKPVAA